MFLCLFVHVLLEAFFCLHCLGDTAMLVLLLYAVLFDTYTVFARNLILALI